jgi:hypothetical protein
MTKIHKSLGAGACLLAVAALVSATQVAAQPRAGQGAAGQRQVRSRAPDTVNRSRNVDRDININRDVDIDVDVDHDWDNGRWHPVAAAATAAAVTAAVVGSYYRTLPANCVTVYRGAVLYYQCGTAWYQPVYSGMTVQYVVVVAP